MAYKSLTDSYIDIVEGKTDEASVDLLRKKLRKIKGITKDQIAVISTMPTPVLTAMINQLGMIVSQKEDVKENITFAGHNSYVGQEQGELAKELEEAPLVASDISILDGILKKIKDDIIKDKLKGRLEKSWPKMQQLAKLAGYNISKKMQAKGKTYRWDLKK